MKHKTRLFRFVESALWSFRSVFLFQNATIPLSFGVSLRFKVPRLTVNIRKIHSEPLAQTVALRSVTWGAAPRGGSGRSWHPTFSPSTQKIPQSTVQLAFFGGFGARKFLCFWTVLLWKHYVYPGEASGFGRTWSTGRDSLAHQGVAGECVCLKHHR